MFLPCFFYWIKFTFYRRGFYILPGKIQVIFYLKVKISIFQNVTIWIEILFKAICLSESWFTWRLINNSCLVITFQTTRANIKSEMIGHDSLRFYLHVSTRFYESSEAIIQGVLLNLFKMGFFRAADGVGAKRPPSLNSVIHILQWWNLVQLYLT